MIDDREELTLADALQEKIKVLHDSIWERRADWPQVSNWLDQFEDEGTSEGDRVHALYLLSNFMYFGTSEIRALLRSLYRDVFRASVIADIRSKDPTLRMHEIEERFESELKNTRFVSLGNPSESSAFLLYYFRQENEIPRECFISGAEIFSHTNPGQLSLLHPDIMHYVFIDDMCGSGSQGAEYSENTVVPLKALKTDAQAYYYALFGAEEGIKLLKGLDRFDKVHSVVELGDSFKCFSDESRIYRDAPVQLSREAGKAIAYRFGSRLVRDHPLGYRNGQLLLGFAYNTPDNTLPIIWSSGTKDVRWAPVFKRYSKLAYS
ncbi:MAG: hypothetical protein RH945_06600 [Hyphomonas sp.]